MFSERRITPKWLFCHTEEGVNILSKPSYLLPAKWDGHNCTFFSFVCLLLARSAVSNSVNPGMHYQNDSPEDASTAVLYQYCTMPLPASVCHMFEAIRIDFSIAIQCQHWDTIEADTGIRMKWGNESTFRSEKMATLASRLASLLFHKSF